MLASLIDPVAAYKKSDSKTARTSLASRLAANRILLLLLLVLGVLLVVFTGGPRGKINADQARDSRRKSVELDDSGNEICLVPTIRRADEFFDDIELVTEECRSMVQLGKTAIAEIIEGDFGIGTRCNESAAHFQWVCLDKRLKIDHSNCLVYSIGVDAEFSFEADMERFGCDVYAFDTEHHSGDFQHSDRIWFQNIRIGADSFDAYHEGKSVEKVRSLHHVVENLGHQERVIDVLKLDVRDHEWQALDQFVHSDVMDQVKQLVVTLNFDRPSSTRHASEQLLKQLTDYYQLLRMLDCDGFRVFSSEGRGEAVRAPHMKRAFHREYEISYVNTNYY